MSITAGEEILIVDETLTINGTNPSISPSTGALVVTGGVGIGGDVYVSGDTTISGNTNLEGILTIGTGTSSYQFPINKGNDGQLLTFNTNSGGLEFSNSNVVNALEDFGTDNRLIKTTGTGVDVEATTLEISDTNDLSGINTLQVVGTSTLGGIVMISDATSSTDTSTGALLVSGGVGIAENINVGGNSLVSGDSNVNGILTLGSGTSGYSFPTETGSSGQILALSTTGSLIFTTSGASPNAVNAPSPFGADNRLVKTQGVNRDLESTGITVSDTDDMSGLATLSVIGGATFGGILTVSDTAQSTNSTTGAMVVTGGMGIGENLNLAGDLLVDNNANVIGSFTIGTGTSSYDFPTTIGSIGQVLTVSSSGGLLFENSSSSATVVNAPIVFGADNRLVKSDGVTRDVQVTGITLSDTDDISGINTINIISDSTIGGSLALTSTTSSTDTTSGSLIVTGGIGISENLNVGGDLTTGGIITVSNTTASTSTGTGGIVIEGGVGIGGDVNIGGTLSAGNISLGTGDLTISSTTQSTSNGTGALTVVGGIGIGGNLNVGGTLDVDSTADIAGVMTVADATQSTDTTSGSLVVSGGVGIAKNLYIGGLTNIENTVQSSSTANGSLTTDGGVGIAKNLNVGGDYELTGTMIINDTTDAVSTGSGALIVEGGVSIEKDLYVGGSLVLENALVSASQFFMAVHTTTTQVSSTTFSALQWDTEIRKDTGLFSHTGADIDVLESGWYKIVVNVATQIEASDGINRTISSARLTVGGLNVTGSASYMYNRTAERGHGTCTIVFLQNLTINDTINVEINRLVGTSTVTSIANATRIFISRI
jgi:hypothetical protein